MKRDNHVSLEEVVLCHPPPRRIQDCLGAVSIEPGECDSEKYTVAEGTEAGGGKDLGENIGQLL